MSDGASCPSPLPLFLQLDPDHEQVASEVEQLRKSERCVPRFIGFDLTPVINTYHDALVVNRETLNLSL